RNSPTRTADQPMHRIMEVSHYGRRSLRASGQRTWRPRPRRAAKPWMAFSYVSVWMPLGFSVGVGIGAETAPAFLVLSPQPARTIPKSGSNTNHANNRPRIQAPSVIKPVWFVRPPPRSLQVVRGYRSV